jgi:hypothetical protein
VNYSNEDISSKISRLLTDLSKVEKKDQMLSVLSALHGHFDQQSGVSLLSMRIESNQLWRVTDVLESHLQDAKIAHHCLKCLEKVTA